MKALASHGLLAAALLLAAAAPAAYLDPDPGESRYPHPRIEPARPIVPPDTGQSFLACHILLAILRQSPAARSRGPLRPLSNRKGSPVESPFSDDA